MGTILVVEDNEDDAYFMRRALKEAAPGVPVRFIEEGKSALHYLRGTGPYTNRTDHPVPAVVFLDLKIPLVHGLDVLASLRREPPLKNLPVFVLTSSSEERDRSRAEELGIQGYLVKPPTKEMLIEALAAIPGMQRDRPV